MNASIFRPGVCLLAPRRSGPADRDFNSAGETKDITSVMLWSFIAALILRLILIFVSGHHPDLINHIDWGEKFWQVGPKNFYENIFWRMSWPNQPLGTVCLFAFISKLSQWIFSFFWWLNIKIPLFPSLVVSFLEAKLNIILVKVPFVLADLGIGWLIYRVVSDLFKNKEKAFWGSLLFLFNPIVIYNSAVWGQTDSLVNLLALSGLWFLFKKKYYLGIFCFLTGFYFKLSLIIWLPIAALIVVRSKEFKKIILPLILTSLFLLLISLPFVHHGNVFTWLWYLYTNRILPRQGNMLSGNAFNFWNLVFGLDLSLKESIPLFGFAAKTWGVLMTGLTFFIFTYFYWSRKEKNFCSYLWLAIGFAFASFLFLTNMHERYLYPVFAPLTILAVAGKIKIRYLVILSLIHLLNLYQLWWYPEIAWLKMVLEAGNFFISRLLSFTLILIFFRFSFLYTRTRKTTVRYPPSAIRPPAEADSSK